MVAENDAQRAAAAARRAEDAAHQAEEAREAVEQAVFNEAGAHPAFSGQDVGADDAGTGGEGSGPGKIKP